MAMRSEDRSSRRRSKPRKQQVLPGDAHRDAVVFDVLHAVKGFTDKELAQASGRIDNKHLARSTIRKLRLGPRYGGTRFPRLLTIEKILSAAKKRLYVGDE